MGDLRLLPKGLPLCVQNRQPPDADEGDGPAREMSPPLFYEIWHQAQERPAGFMGMFF